MTCGTDEVLSIFWHYNWPLGFLKGIMKFSDRSSLIWILPMMNLFIITAAMTSLFKSTFTTKSNSLHLYKTNIAQQSFNIMLLCSYIFTVYWCNVHPKASESFPICSACLNNTPDELQHLAATQWNFMFRISQFLNHSLSSINVLEW